MREGHKIRVFGRQRIRKISGSEGISYLRIPEHYEREHVYQYTPPGILKVAECAKKPAVC